MGYFNNIFCIEISFFQYLILNLRRSSSAFLEQRSEEELQPLKLKIYPVLGSFVVVVVLGGEERQGLSTQP